MGGIIVDAYGERKYQEVMQDTWGHLAPEPGTKYEGYLTFAHSDYSSQGSIIIEARFEGLDDSPWFFQDLNDYIADKTKDEQQIENVRVHVLLGREEKDLRQLLTRRLERVHAQHLAEACTRSADRFSTARDEAWMTRCVCEIRDLDAAA